MPRHHRVEFRRIAPALIIAGLFALGTARGEQITQIVSFGDSLSDVGNFYAATGGVSPPTQWGYAAGEFTNGLNWVQYLAQDLGVPVPTPSTSGGTDYAYGGAMTGPGTTPGSFWDASGASVTATVPNMDTQIAQYLATNTPTATTLYTLWGGANDFLHGSSPNPFTTAANIVNEVTTLAQAGATQFLVGNLPPLGELPYIKANESSLSQTLDALTVAFNGILQSELAALQAQLGVQIHLMDVYSLYNDAISNPSKYGFTNVTDAALFVSNGQGYLSWDGIHPTTQADQLVAQLGAQSVPEPSSLVLLGIAVASVWIRGRRRRV